MDAWIKNLMCGTQRCAVWSPVRGTPQASIQRNAGAVYKGVCNVLLMFSLRGFDWFSLAGTSWQAPTASSGAWSRHVSSWESWRPGSKHVGKTWKNKGHWEWKKTLPLQRRNIRGQSACREIDSIPIPRCKGPMEHHGTPPTWQEIVEVAKK